MDRQFPREIRMFATRPNVKKAFISITEPTNPNDCKNCGGAEIFALFCATKARSSLPQRLGKGRGILSDFALR